MGDSEDEFRELRGRRRGRLQSAGHDGGGRPREAAQERGRGRARRGGPPGAGGRERVQGRGGEEEDAARPPPPHPAGPPRAPPAGQQDLDLAFCQLCQQDLSAMSAPRRQQHVNRCLDDLERLHPPSASIPGIPECPICGKRFSTLKSRGSHLKRCAIKMEIPPPLLLQAVRQQASALGSSCPPVLRGLKRKVSSSLEQAMEKDKQVKTEGLTEDLLLAMELSRAHLASRETKAKPPTSRRQDGPSHARKRLKAERQTREKPPQLPPPLLLQDPEKARKQTEERVALLLAEAEEFPSTPPLPTSKLLEVERSRQTHLVLPAGLCCSLWEFSSLTGPCAAPGSFRAMGFTLPVTPPTDQRPAPGTAEQMVEQVPPGARCHQGVACEDLPGSIPKPTCSQKDGEALQDLVELAEEGLTLTQWKLDVQQGEKSGQEQEQGNVPQNHVVQSQERGLLQRRCNQTFLLSSLAAAFRGMVNNPHLSDLQFQVDSGEVIYAHMFVLYARCPQLMEFVDHKGFLVAEGDVRTRRVLLDDVSEEAVRVFLSHLYASDHAIPPHMLSDVTALAVRFGVQDLAALCRDQASRGLDRREEEDGAERADAFEELLESMWVGENKEQETVLHPEEESIEDMGEQELEEIYEFAATQRKAALSRAGEERGSNECKRQTVALEEATSVMATLTRKGNFDPELFELRVQDTTREEGMKAYPLEPLQDPKGTQPFGEPETEAALGLVGEDQPELNESSASLFSMAQGGSFELIQQSPDTKEPSKDPTARKSFLVLAGGPSMCPGGWTRSNSLFNNLPLPMSPPIASSPKGRGVRSRKLSQTLAAPLLSASLTSVAGNKEEHAIRNPSASLGQALGKGSPALPSPPSHMVLEDDFILLSDSDEEMELGPEQLQAGASGKETRVPAAASGSQRQCVDKEESEDPLSEMRVCREAASQQRLSQGSEKEDCWAEGSSRSKGEEILLVPDIPQLGERGSSAQPLSKAGPEDQWAQGTQARQSSSVSLASVQSPKGSLSPLSLSGDEKPAQGPLSGLPRPVPEVVIVDDSEEEQDAAPLSWDSRRLGENLHFSEGESSGLLPSAGPERAAAFSGRSQAPAKGLGNNNSPLSRMASLHFGEAEVSESSHRRGAPWDAEDSDDEDILPLTQLLPATLPLQKTPELACQTKELPCTTPLTPLPSYSIMETPELKKELSRFGVRALPKRQMVLKLKEIFQYTHQSKEADTKHKATSSQPTSRCSRAKAVRRAPKSVVPSSTSPKQLSENAEPLQDRQNGKGLSRAGAGGFGQMTEVQCLQGGSGEPKGAVLSPTRLPAEVDTDGLLLTASQESTESSVSGSDASLLSQSSSTEFEPSVLAEEEEEEGISASQTAAREADKLEDLRRYIYSKPSLHRQILLYQPFELAGLQAELKQNGIRLALGKLLDFLDAHCITFTTAEARREKQQRSRRKGRKRF